MLQDIENTPTYQRLVEKGREEGRAEIRQSVLDIVQLRFPSLSVLVKARIEQITDLT